MFHLFLYSFTCAFLSNKIIPIDYQADKYDLECQMKEKKEVVEIKVPCNSYETIRITPSYSHFYEIDYSEKYFTREKPLL